MKNWHKVVGGIVSVAAIAAVSVLNTPHHVGPAYLYPNPSLTPGLVATQDFGALTASNPTYSQAHRNTTEGQKKQVRANYPKAVCATPSDCEIDHFCPLALGCADDVQNLWVQPAANDWQGQDYGYHAKDKLESRLVLEMKAGKVSPKDAQQCILRDWVACYQKYFGTQPSFGGVGNAVDPDLEGVQ